MTRQEKWQQENMAQLTSLREKLDGILKNGLSIVFGDNTSGRLHKYAKYELYWLERPSRLPGLFMGEKLWFYAFGSQLSLTVVGVDAALLAYEVELGYEGNIKEDKPKHDLSYLYLPPAPVVLPAVVPVDF